MIHVVLYRTVSHVLLQNSVFNLDLLSSDGRKMVQENNKPIAHQMLFPSNDGNLFPFRNVGGRYFKVKV